MDAPFVNMHTHQYVPGGSLQVVSFDIGETDVAHHLGDSPYITAGIHPYHAAKYGDTDISKLFCPFASQLAGIGEIGLDRTINAPIELQTDIFTQQLMIARERHLPAIIHCVKAYSDILGIMKSFGDIVYIFHGYYADKQATEHLLKHNCYFSVGLRELSRAKADERLLALPLNRLLLETDNQEWTIDEVYSRASNFYGIGMNNLKEQIYNNFNLAINARMD